MATYSPIVEDLSSDVSQSTNSVHQSCRVLVTNSLRKSKRQLKRCFTNARRSLKISPLCLMEALSEENNIQQNGDYRIIHPSLNNSTIQQLQINSTKRKMGRGNKVHPADDNPVITTANTESFQQTQCSGKVELTLGINSKKGRLAAITIHIHGIEDVQPAFGSGYGPVYFTRVAILDDELADIIGHNILVDSESNSRAIINEMVTFELFPTDVSHRLCISLYNYNPENNCDELMGCTSFSIGNILQQRDSSSGWYQLLDKELDARSHIKVEESTTTKIYRSDSLTVGGVQRTAL